MIELPSTVDANSVNLLLSWIQALAAPVHEDRELDSLQLAEEDEHHSSLSFQYRDLEIPAMEMKITSSLYSSQRLVKSTNLQTFIVSSRD